MASALEIVSRLLASLDPTRLENNLPTSSLRRGIDQLSEIDLAVKDFPVPCGPTNKTPLGIGNPYYWASFEKALYLCLSQVFNNFKPPISF